MAATAARIGVLTYETAQPPDAILAEAVHRLGAQGLRVSGLIQHGAASDGTCCAALYLDDIDTGRRVRIFEERSPGGRGCRLDPSGLADAASWLRTAIDRRPDILFVNRFGRQEAQGRGLMNEIAAAFIAEIPIVIAVSKTLWPDFDCFAGEAAVVLPNSTAAVEEWCLAQVLEPVADRRGRESRHAGAW